MFFSGKFSVLFLNGGGGGGAELAILLLQASLSVLLLLLHSKVGARNETRSYPWPTSVYSQSKAYHKVKNWDHFCFYQHKFPLPIVLGKKNKRILKIKRQQ